MRSTADKLDNFLSGDDEIVTGANETRLIIGQRLIWNEGGEWDHKPSADIRLHLPKFAEKWRLRFTTYDTDDEEVGIKATRARTTQRDEELGLSVFFLSTFEKINMTFRPRIDGDGTSHVLRFRRPSDFWVLQFNPKFELFARAAEGTGQFLALNFNYNVSDNVVFTFLNEEQYTDLNNKMSTNHGFAFRQRISDNKTQFYSLIYQSDNQPHYRLMEYTLSTSFEHYLKNRSIVYRLNPNMVYQRVNKFHGNPSMTFELDFIF